MTLKLGQEEWRCRKTNNDDVEVGPRRNWMTMQKDQEWCRLVMRISKPVLVSNCTNLKRSKMYKPQTPDTRRVFITPIRQEERIILSNQRCPKRTVKLRMLRCKHTGQTWESYAFNCADDGESTTVLHVQMFSTVESENKFQSKVGYLSTKTIYM